MWFPLGFKKYLEYLRIPHFRFENERHTALGCEHPPDPTPSLSRVRWGPSSSAGETGPLSPAARSWLCRRSQPGAGGPVSSEWAALLGWVHPAPCWSSPAPWPARALAQLWISVSCTCQMGEFYGCGLHLNKVTCVMHTFIWIKPEISNFPCFEGMSAPN